MAVTSPQTETVFVSTGHTGRPKTTIPAILFILPSIVMLALLLVLPMGQAFLRSLQSDAGWGIDNYSRAFRHDDLARLALKHTFIFAALSVVGQYLIGFEPAKLDDKMHKIEVKVKKPGMKVRARKEYQATK